MKARMWGEGLNPFARPLCPIFLLPAPPWATKPRPNSSRSLSHAAYIKRQLLLRRLKSPLLDRKESGPGEGWELCLVTVQLWHRCTEGPLTPAWQRGSPSRASSAQRVPLLLRRRTSRAEGVTRTPCCCQNGADCPTETPRPFLKNSFRRAPRKPKARLYLWLGAVPEGWQGWRSSSTSSCPAGQRRGREATGDEKKKKKKNKKRRRLLHGLCWCVAATGRGSPPMRAFGVHLPACSAFTASGWGLGFAFLVLMFGVSFSIHPFPLCKTIFSELFFGWFFFHFLWWFLVHAHSAAAGLSFWYQIWPDFKRDLCDYSQCAAWGINRNFKL